MHERLLFGAEYLNAATALLNRIRNEHPTWGLFEAADLQWWWRTPRPTDESGQLFWFDQVGAPIAAAVLTEWTDFVAMDVLVGRNAERSIVEQVVVRALEHAADVGVGRIELEVDEHDHVLQEILLERDFVNDGTALIEAWLPAERVPGLSELVPGYRLTTRSESPDGEHHMVDRSGPRVEERLQQTSLYRPDLDLLVVDAQHEPAAIGLFWLDPATGCGLVEPMATEEPHRRRGLARHVLTAGVRRLVELGARRVKICFDPDNLAAANLYQDVGFVPAKTTVRFTRS